MAGTCGVEAQPAASRCAAQGAANTKRSQHCTLRKDPPWCPVCGQRCFQHARLTGKRLRCSPLPAPASSVTRCRDPYICAAEEQNHGVRRTKASMQAAFAACAHLLQSAPAFRASAADKNRGLIHFFPRLQQQLGLSLLSHCPLSPSARSRPGSPPERPRPRPLPCAACPWLARPPRRVAALCIWRASACWFLAGHLELKSYCRRPGSRAL